MMKLTRISKEPIFKPIEKHKWENAAVFNCAAVYEKGLFHMIYRATDIGGKEKTWGDIKPLGFAVSKKLLNLYRLSETGLNNSVSQELKGAEGPRIVK
nr:glycosidase [Candidatus Neomarinimicrobiota bacterium]